MADAFSAESSTSELAPQTVDAVHRYLTRGAPLSIGDGAGVIRQLEEELSRVLGIATVITCSSGTAALHSAYLALDLPPGSEVIAPVTTFHASITPALHCGLSPVLVDVEADTGNLSVSAVEQALTNRTRCVVVTHNLGQPADLDAIAAVCRRHDLRLIEDCSHAYLSTYRGRPVGTYGDISVWSMQARKTLVAGEGGFLSTADQTLLDRACLAGHYRGRSEAQIADPLLRRFADTGLGLKYRLHPIAAVIALSELQLLAERVARRGRLLERLSRRLADIPGLKAPAVHPQRTMGGWFSYRPSLAYELDLDQFLRHLSAAGVPAHRPSVASLDEFPLFQGPAPLKHAEATWRPRLHGPFRGAREFERNRFSIAVSARDDEPKIDAYADAMGKAAAAVGAQ